MTQNENNRVDKQKVDLFIMTNTKFFPAEKIVFLKEKLYAADDSKYMMASAVELKNPTTMLIISVLLGGLGVDRFMLKDMGMGVLKLLTGGCCGVLAVIDWINIQKKTQEFNFNNLMAVL